MVKTPQQAKYGVIVIYHDIMGSLVDSKIFNLLDRQDSIKLNQKFDIALYLVSMQDGKVIKPILEAKITHVNTNNTEANEYNTLNDSSCAVDAVFNYLKNLKNRKIKDNNNAPLVIFKEYKYQCVRV